MSKVADFEAIKGAKVEPCEYCGEAEHKGTFACPRIRSVQYDQEDDIVTVRFWAPKDLAGRF